jgi:hypothetical protein
LSNTGQHSLVWKLGELLGQSRHRWIQQADRSRQPETDLRVSANRLQRNYYAMRMITN